MLPTHISLRPEEPGDEPSLFRLYASTRADELALTGWDDTACERFLRMQFQAQRAGYREMFPHAQFAIILSEGSPVGRVVIDRPEDEIRIVDLVIAPEYRGRGIGGALMSSIMAEAATSSTPLRLKVITGTPAQRWYERLGFSLVEDGDVYLEMERSPTSVRASTK